MELARLPITQVARALSTRALSPVELVQELLSRIDKLNPLLNAYLTVTPEAALRAAQIAEQEIGSHRYRGPLHGIPIAHKDLLATQGVRTTAHSNLLRRWIPKEDAVVVRRLTEAGAISLGKLALHEFALIPPGPDVAFPPARNPWDLSRSPGGSSSGSGSAIAAGLAFGATGTDTGGSIRHPSAVCGVVGMKPTYGRISLQGVIPLAPSFDHVGPMTRTVRDNALMLQAMVASDASGSVQCATPNFSAQIGKSVRHLKAGVLWRQIEQNPHDPQVLRGFVAACDVLRSQGITLHDVRLPEVDFNRDGRLLLGLEALGFHAERLLKRPEGYSKRMRDELRQFARISEAERARAERTRREVTASIRAVFDSGIDFLISPGREAPADLLDDSVRPSTPRGQAYRAYSLAGVPALVVPAGYTDAGLPVSLQLAADYWREDLLYKIGAAYEDETGWWRRSPSL